MKSTVEVMSSRGMNWYIVKGVLFIYTVFILQCYSFFPLITGLNTILPRDELSQHAFVDPLSDPDI